MFKICFIDEQTALPASIGDGVSLSSVTVNEDGSNGFYITYNIEECGYGLDLVRIVGITPTHTSTDRLLYGVGSHSNKCCQTQFVSRFNLHVST